MTCSVSSPNERGRKKKKWHVQGRINKDFLCSSSVTVPSCSVPRVTVLCLLFLLFPFLFFVWHANSHLAFKAWLRRHHYHNLIWCVHLACSLFINCFFNQFYCSQTWITEWRSEWMMMNLTHYSEFDLICKRSVPKNLICGAKLNYWS